MYTGKSKAWVDILRIAVAERTKYDSVLKAAEERADRREHQTGTRPDPKNSSNVKEQRAIVRTVEQCLGYVFQEMRSERYHEVGYEPVHTYGEKWTDLIEAGHDYFGRGSGGTKTREEAAALREENERRLEDAVEMVIVEPKSEEYLVEAHRQKVLRGEEEPTEADHEWLTAKAREAAESAATMQAEAERLMQKVDARATKARETAGKRK